MDDIGFNRPPRHPFSQRSRHALFGNVPINGLNEWNVHKLGWLKHDRVSRRSRGVSREGFPVASTFITSLCFEKLSGFITYHFIEN